MKYLSVLLPFLLLISACRISTEEGAAPPQLTPYNTHMAATETPVQEEKEAEGVGTPIPTSTPVIHVVSLGETISSIALKYGVSIDAILLANPDISPKVMVVGDAVVIPAGDQGDVGTLNPAVMAGVKLGQPNCYFSGEGLWCGVLLENPTDINLEFPVVTFSFFDDGGVTLLEKRAPAVMRGLQPGLTIPAVLFLETVPPGFAQAEAELYSALIARADGQSIEVMVQDSATQLDSFSAEASGTVRVVSGQTSAPADLTIVAAAFDGSGKMVGVRRMDRTVTLNESFEFLLTVFSSGGEIVDVVLYVEAY